MYLSVSTLVFIPPTVLYISVLSQNPADSVEVVEKRITGYNMYAEDKAEHSTACQC